MARAYDRPTVQRINHAAIDVIKIIIINGFARIVDLLIGRQRVNSLPSGHHHNAQNTAPRHHRRDLRQAYYIIRHHHRICDHTAAAAKPVMNRARHIITIYTIFP